MKLIPVRLSIVRPSQKRDFDIYIINETKPLLFLSKNTPIKKDSTIFKNNANRLIYISSTQLSFYQKSISDNLNDILSDKEISKINKMYAIYISLTSQLELLMNNANINIANDLSKNISLFIANTLNNTSSISIFFSFIKSKSHNIATHMFNVGIYATMLTKMLYPNISKTQIEKLSKGYFMHDIGMLKIDKNIINKKDRYTKEEYEEIKKHPILGTEIIKNELKISDINILKIVLEHHERKNGSGYPYGKTNINRFARICSMCDIFDAITSKREYRENSTPKTTFEALKDNRDFFIEEFDREYYEAFVKCFKGN